MSSSWGGGGSRRLTAACALAAAERDTLLFPHQVGGVQFDSGPPAVDGPGPVVALDEEQEQGRKNGDVEEDAYSKMCQLVRKVQGAEPQVFQPGESVFAAAATDCYRERRS